MTMNIQLVYELRVCGEWVCMFVFSTYRHPDSFDENGEKEF